MATQHARGILTAVALAATAAAQTGWVQRLTSQPPARAYHAMTFDLARGTTLLFGGSNGQQAFADTWEWSGANWMPKSTAHSPPARFGHALTADLIRGHVVMFGGSSGGSDVNDTWEYDGNDWAQTPTQNQPSARRFAGMEYDAARARSVLFGGVSGSASVLGETWEWNGVAWTLRTPATAPPPRWGHVMAYDFARARTLLTSGSRSTTIHLADTWTWDGTNWSQALVTAPTPSWGYGLAYDAGHDVVVRFGGNGSGAETWLFDDASWRRDPRSLAPLPRHGSPMAHDLLRSRTIVFGGDAPTSTWYFNDTWEYDPGVIARWTRSGSGCAGTAGVPTLRPIGGSLPIVGSTFVLELLGVPGSGAAISIGLSDQQWNGNPLPWSLGALGMTGCTLHASPDFLFFAPVVAGRATLSWQLPNDPGLIGTRLFDQGFVLAPGVNPLGAIVSNAGTGIIGPF